VVVVRVMERDIKSLYTALRIVILDNTILVYVEVYYRTLKTSPNKHFPHWV
jgi:hypothetical protein